MISAEALFYINASENFDNIKGASPRRSNMRRTGEQQRAYLSETAIALKRKGFTVQTEENGLLPVKWNGQPLCLRKALASGH